MQRTSIARARRRSAAERHVLVPLQRHIGVFDRVSRQKYVQDFTEAYRTYIRILSKEDLFRFCCEADILLISDFHAVESCQAFLREVVQELSKSQSRPMVLLLETIFTRDQHILDEWQAGTISDSELRQRIRFDTDWGYAWEPILETLKTARALGIPIYGADCPPRGNMRRISQRDRHAGQAVAKARKRHPDALIIVLFGESHLAPNHLPLHVREKLPSERMRMVLQNVDALYFRAAGELRHKIEALQVDPLTAAVFNSTPVEKWQSYRMWLSRWRNQPNTRSDFSPALYDLIEALLSFLQIGRYPTDDDGESRYLVDSYPEVASVSSLEQARTLLLRKTISKQVRQRAMEDVVEHGMCYMPELNLVVIRHFRMQSATRVAAKFVHHACREFEGSNVIAIDHHSREDALYRQAMEHALTHFGARVLYPSHPVSDEEDLFAFYDLPREEVEASSLLSYGDYMRMLDCVALHRDYELHSRSYAVKPRALQEFFTAAPSAHTLLAQHLGALLGGDLYSAYLAGRLTRREARSLFFRRLSRGARDAYFSTVRKVRQRQADLLAA
jgi:hypothetical protein